MRRVLVLLTVVVFAGVVAFVFLRHGESSEALCAPVERLLSQGNVAAARAERESVRGRADAGWNDYLDGIFLLADGKDREAADVLDRARRAHPDAWRIASASASATANAGRFAEARAILESYVASAPDDERGLAAVARCLLDDRFGPPDAAKALATLDRVAALPPRAQPRDDGTAVADATLHRLRAKALVIAGRYTNAVDEAREATRADPQNAEAWYLLGDAARLSKVANGDETLDAYRRAFELAPKNRRYGEQFVMATLKIVVPGTEAQRFADALTAVDAMLRGAPDDPALLIFKARLFARSEQTLDASNEIYVELQKRSLPKELRLQVLRNRGVLLYDFAAAGRPGPYLKDAYDLLKQYVDEGGAMDDELRKPWKELQQYAPK